MEEMTLANLLTIVTSVLSFVVTSIGSVFTFLVNNPLGQLSIAISVVGIVWSWAMRFKNIV